MFICQSCIRECAKSIPGSILKQSLKSFLLRTFHNDTIKATPTPRPGVVQQKERPPSASSEGSMMRRPRPGKDDQKKNAQSLHYKRITDPLKLAEATLRLLRSDQREPALKRVRVFSRDAQCTVSWNHIINHDLSKGRVVEAIKTFNEMKKRGQHPDGYTYTIIFRGLAKYPHYKQSVKRALTVYHAMFAQNSPVRPSTIHTNAIITVCARAQDLDAILGITSRLPEFGAGTPDATTYTIILNCLREVAWKDGNILKHETYEDKVKRRRDAVMMGRRLWPDIVKKWSKGMTIDEALVAAMARLLIMSDTDQDCDDILSLVQQTMAIPRQIPPIGDPTRATHFGFRPSRESEKEREGNDQPVFEAEAEGPMSIDEDISTEMMIRDRPPSEFAPLKSSSKMQFLARPGCNILSVIMDACTRMNAAKAANSYWKMITSEVEPDLENYNMYLRHLRRQRASTAALSTLRELSKPKDEGGKGLQAEVKTYRLALSACSRDSRNPFSLETATSILRLMFEEISNVDLRAMEIFATLLQESRSRPVRAIDQMVSATETMFELWKKAQRQLRVNSSRVADKSIERHLKVGKTFSAARNNRDEFVKISALVRAQIDRVNNRYWRQLDRPQTRQLTKMQLLVTGKSVRKAEFAQEMAKMSSLVVEDEEDEEEEQEQEPARDSPRPRRVLSA